MLRFILLILLLLISLLTIIKAPTYQLWLMAIMATEYSIIFIGVIILLLLSGWWVNKYQLMGTITGIIALLLFARPLASAYTIGRHLKSDLDKAFVTPVHTHQKQSDTAAPFSFTALFKSSPAMKFKSFTYITYADTSLSLDFYPAQAKDKRPCVIIIHGGSWSSGDSRQLPELNTRLSQLGYNVASINYRLAPKWQNPAPVQDVMAALHYLRSHADELQIDTSRFVLLGRSAGAQIALLAAYTLPRDVGIKGVINFYGPADMVWGYSIPSPKLVMDSRRVMANYLGGYYPKVPQNYKASSPIEFVNRQTVPTLLIHGANDVLVAYEHSDRLSVRLGQNGVPHYWLQLPWATHGFDYHLNGPGGQLSTYAVAQFLDKVVD